MKSLFKNLILEILSWQVRRLYKRAEFKVVAVGGSIGKTSTKHAIAEVAAEKYAVRFQAGNYNHLITVPLIFFGLPQPGLYNPLAWLKTILRAESQLHKPYPYDLVIVEVGTDVPGDIPSFKKYLKADIGVVTAITPEHMEFFETMDEVAREELSIASFSDRLVANKDLCGKYLKKKDRFITYGTNNAPDYQLIRKVNKAQGFDFEVKKVGETFVSGVYGGVAESQLYSITAAVAVADLLEVPKSKIQSGVSRVKPVNGRMRRLDGIKNSTILDDTYNASPDATYAALDTLYRIDAPYKIALLGNMNELGKISAQAHEDVGKYCDSKQVNLVVTLGPDANKYLAPAAKGQGCRVETAEDFNDAADIIKTNMKQRTLILAKGSQNGVFAEEAVKKLLADIKDRELLVRQSPEWLKKKEKLMNLRLG